MSLAVVGELRITANQRPGKSMLRNGSVIPLQTLFVPCSTFVSCSFDSEIGSYPALQL